MQQQVDMQQEEIMCPACMASLALVAGSVVTSGGLTAFLVKIFVARRTRSLTTAQ